jgi:hypothetical protein
MAWTTGQNVISGGEGTLQIEDASNLITLANVTKLEANIDKDKSEIQVVGKRMNLHKTVGLAGSGTLSLYYLSARFREDLKEYKDSGTDRYYEITATNNDLSSGAGKQVVVLHGVNFDSIPLSLLDGSHTELTEDLDFTFEDYDITTPFTKDADVETTAPKA